MTRPWRPLAQLLPQQLLQLQLPPCPPCTPTLCCAPWRPSTPWTPPSCQSSSPPPAPARPSTPCWPAALAAPAWLLPWQRAPWAGQWGSVAVAVAVAQAQAQQRSQHHLRLHAWMQQPWGRAAAGCSWQQRRAQRGPGPLWPLLPGLQPSACCGTTWPWLACRQPALAVAVAVAVAAPPWRCPCACGATTCTQPCPVPWPA